MELFRPYTSLFRDPGIDEATTKMVERYYKNMEYSDALGQKLNELQNAPFSGDAAINKELKSLVNSGLEGLAAEGRYEHSEKELRKLATRFNTIAPGIMQNNALYAKANQDLKERLEKKEINDEQYALSSAYNTYGYEGLKLDTTGRVDQNTYFSGKTIYNDPKPIDMLSGRFKDLLQRTQNIENASVGQNAEGKWTYTVGDKTMQFNDNDVTAVVNSVITDPNVQGYVSQLGDMRSINALAAGKAEDLLTGEIASAKDRLAQLQTERGSANKEQIPEYDAAIESIGKEMTKYQEALNSGDSNQMAQVIKELSTQQEYDKINAYGNTQRGLQSYEKVRKRDQDYAKSNERYKAYLNLGMMTTTPGEITAATDGTGATMDEKKNFLVNAQSESDKYGKLLEDKTLSDDLRGTYEGLKRAADLKVQQVSNTLKTASDKAISMVELEKADPKIVRVFKSLMPNATAGDIYQQLQRTFDNPGDQDYKDFEAAFMGQYNEPLSKYITSSKFAKTPIVTQFSQEEKAMAAGMALAGQPYTYSEGYKGVSEYFADSFSDKVDKAFKEIKTSSEFTNQITMPTEEETVRATTGVNSFFGIMGGNTGRPLRDTEEIIVDGQVKYGKDLPGFNIVKWQFSPNANMFEIQVKDGDGNTKTIQMPGEQVSQPMGKDAVLNSPVQKFATEINQNSYGLDNSKSTRIDGVWEFAGEPLDYEISNVNGTNNIKFYRSGSNTPVAITPGSDKTTFTLSDQEIKSLFNTGQVKAVPKRKVTKFTF
jgi:hypothetical protein